MLDQAQPLPHIAHLVGQRGDAGAEKIEGDRRDATHVLGLVLRALARSARASSSRPGVRTRGGSFAAAATELNVSPAAISRMVRLFEERLGVALFEREANRLTLTAAGAWLIRYSARPGVKTNRPVVIPAEQQGTYTIEAGIVTFSGNNVSPAFTRLKVASVTDTDLILETASGPVVIYTFKRVAGP